MDPALASELKERRARLETVVNQLKDFAEPGESGGVDLLAAAKAAEEAEQQRKRVGSCGDYVKVAVGIVKNTISGVLTVYLYFMDLISDYQVTMLYYNTGALRFAGLSMFLIISQFAVVWMRCLPYLHDTYGGDALFGSRAHTAPHDLPTIVAHASHCCSK